MAALNASRTTQELLQGYLVEGNDRNQRVPQMIDHRRFSITSAAILTSLISIAAVNAQAAGPAAQFQPFKIGNYSAVSLKDGTLEEPVDGKSFVVGQSNEAVSSVLRAGGAPGDHFEFSIQAL
ncbi:MAG: hypothetical protein QOF42_1094, partial [Gammaproteobacteria bacterium]|nr:hypothetical protein [Gammaproteobacteria bacterium]